MGDAEVLPQHVTGEDVGGHQVFDGVSVLDHAALDLLTSTHGRRALVGGVGATRIKCLLQIDVERDHAPLDIDVLDDDFQRAGHVATDCTQHHRPQAL